MATAHKKKTSAATVQDVCIDLPGETVQCWRSSDNIRVVLRKHWDVIFDISLQAGALYTVESKSDFYSPVQKKLLRKTDFLDGDRCHLWVGREFKDKLVLKMNGRVLGTYEVNRLDATSYGTDPKTKPEPLMVVMGKKEASAPFMCTPEDPFGVSSAQSLGMAPFEPKLSVLKDLGTKFDYTYLRQSPEVREYVAVTEASSNEIQPQILTQLETGVAVQGTVNQIFLPPKSGHPSLLYTALFTAAGNLSRNEFLTGNNFKESAGYLVENFRELNKVFMRVHIETKAKGKYRVAIKGYLASDVLGKMTGAVQNLKHTHINTPLGSGKSTFIDGGFGRTGKAGYGGFKRMVMTSAQNFSKGLKIQAIGTVIDLIVDVNAVYFDEKGSRDFSEFLGRAGVSLAKAGATAALGSAFAAFGAAGLAVIFGVSGVPVMLAVVVVVGGFIGAAMLVDLIDDGLNIKENVAKWVR